MTKNRIFFLFLIFLFLSFNTSTYSKTKAFSFEVESFDSKLIQCIKVKEIKSERSFIKTLKKFGLSSDTSFIINFKNLFIYFKFVK